jgi:colanic acid biosynthesis protein WcaH
MTSECTSINELERTPVRLPPELFLSIVELTPLVSLDFVVRDSAGRMLVGYCRNRPARGFWFVPGGRLGKNETRREAFGRLTLAELGVELDFARGRFIGVFEHLYPDNFAAEPRLGTHYVVLAYAIEAKPAELRLPDDQHARYAWLDEGEMLRRDDVHDYSKAYCARLHN